MDLKSLLFFSFIFLFSSCSLLNSGTVHIKYTKFRTKIDDVTYENKKNLGDVSFSVRNVQHPYRYGKWNLTFKLSPSIHYERHTLGTLHRAQNDDGVVEQLPDLKIRRLSGLGNLKLILHTPIGAFAATGGFGGALSKIEGNGYTDDDYMTTEIRKVDFVYYKFLTKRIFILFGPRYYKENYEQITVAFRLGYYWGKF